MQTVTPCCDHVACNDNIELRSTAVFQHLNATVALVRIAQAGDVFYSLICLAAQDILYVMKMFTCCVLSKTEYTHTLFKSIV